MLRAQSLYSFLVTGSNRAKLQRLLCWPPKTYFSGISAIDVQCCAPDCLMGQKKMAQLLTMRWPWPRRVGEIWSLLGCVCVCVYIYIYIYIALSKCFKCLASEGRQQGVNSTLLISLLQPFSLDLLWIPFVSRISTDTAGEPCNLRPVCAVVPFLHVLQFFRPHTNNSV